MARDGDREQRWASRIGVLALVVGVVGAVVVWLLAAKRYDDAVADLAPAPVGCDTTLQFARTGTYTFFLETAGEVGELDGDCGRDDRSYDLEDETPRVQLTLVGPAGDEVDLDRADGPNYDRGGSSGSGVRTVDIDDAGEYVLTVASDDDEAVVRVGRDPERGVATLRLVAGALLLTGVVIGVIALLRGRRRSPEQPPDRGAGWPTVPAPSPIAPPVAPGPAPPYGFAPPRPVSAGPPVTALPPPPSSPRPMPPPGPR